jgi:hypothetical protein
MRLLHILTGRFVRYASSLILIISLLAGPGAIVLLKYEDGELSSIVEQSHLMAE